MIEKALNRLQVNITKLADAYHKSKQEAERLKATIEEKDAKNAELKSQIASLQNQVAKLTNENNVLSVAKALNSSEDDQTGSSTAKRRIDHLVREIDKCITLLDKQI